MARGFTAKDVTDQSGRTFLVTGANTGIGLEAAAVLAARGGRVLFGCRDETRARDAMARVQRRVGGAELEFVQLDQGDLSSVAAAAEQVKQEPRLDVLVNNAGVMVPPLTRTAEGFESQFGVNHLGTFALTAHLLPMLAQQEGSRVVTTSSLAHLAGRIDFDDINAERSYDRQHRYRQSKLANLLFALELDRRLRSSGSSVASVACHPGIAATDLARHLPFDSLFMPIISLVLNSPAQGAWPTLMAATDPGVSSGEYLGPAGRREMSGPGTRARIAGRARDESVARRLWELSVEMTGVDPGI